MIDDKITIGITGTGSLIGQAIIKSIKSSIFKDKSLLIGMDYFKGTIGSYWCNKNFILNDLLKKELLEKWEDQIIEIINNSKIQILFIGVDFELIHFARIREKIEKETFCKVVVSREEIIEIADDKYLTYKFLKENSLYYPETEIYEGSSYHTIQFPCIIKPRNGCRSRGVFQINTKEEFNSLITSIQKPIIQELIGHDETEYTCGVIYLEKFIDSIVLKRKLNEGNTSIAIFEKNSPKIISDYIYDIAEKLKPFGACNLQLRLGDDGIPKLFEINARHSGTTFIRSLFGFNEVERIIGHLFNIETPKPVLKEGKVMRFFDEFYTQEIS